MDWPTSLDLEEDEEEEEESMGGHQEDLDMQLLQGGYPQQSQSQEQDMLP